MRAKRSKKYRKLMHQYELTFGFREPYQVLVDSNFLRAVHGFKMELIPALERTLQGKAKPLLTKCSLAAIMAAQPINPKTNNPYRPHHLPPPTELPLRHCSHNEDSTPIDEVECLLSLLSPTGLGAGKKNKEHYILATADPTTDKAAAAASSSGGDAKKRKRGDADGIAQLRQAQALRRAARSIPGVPIVYVKRSVMVLEPMSSPSDTVREDTERGKFRAGLDGDSSSLGKRKRAEEGDDKNKKNKKQGPKKAKAPNPLSMKKPKKRAEAAGSRPTSTTAETDSHNEPRERTTEEGENAAPKAKRRRRHHKGGKGDEAGEEASGPAVEADD
ncbi:hypothetical protein ASPZODRAFT_94965 [Penicilliopsis zonata CBS 506.65]|uniref:UTP23 sensor motif region domain-containing protein n=1 Tax=Penicilliopsis zonata CBS 506.65 TaxID=1073090 RepID=A0A1L9SL67_9EURO|nr:hypothetical protein ASPZODRAFT_94965 [Penicilliopsis zonata CBS 506.65]OJJ47935.1 hypothetical protein ASPZODRAFT_94965 [Penicilliopsis zonata CBS 506.65]